MLILHDPNLSDDLDDTPSCFVVTVVNAFRPSLRHSLCTLAALEEWPIEQELAESEDMLEGAVVGAGTKLILAYLHDCVARVEVRVG